MAHKAFKVADPVAKDPKIGRWNVSRNDVPLGGFSLKKVTASGLSYRQASLEQAVTEPDVRVYSVEGKIAPRNGPRPKMQNDQFTVSATQRAHLVALDSLRGIAAMWVAAFHFGTVSQIVAVIFHNGYLMVDLFFILSGFTIFYAYNDRLETASQLRHFIWLRFWRLYPLHFVILAVFVFAEVAKPLVGSLVQIHHPAFAINTIWDLVANLFLLQGLHLTDGYAFNGPAWSISAEFFAYLFFAVLALTLRTRANLLLASAAIFVGASTALLTLFPDMSMGFDYGWVRCAAGFFLGVLTYSVYATYQARANRHESSTNVAALLSLLLLGAFVVFAPGMNRWDYMIIPLSAFVIFFLALAPSDGAIKFLSNSALRWLGQISYSIYMVHAAIAYVFVRAFSSSTPRSAGSQIAIFLIYVAVVIAAASATFVVIEKPFRAWSRNVRSPRRVAPAGHSSV